MSNSPFFSIVLPTLNRANYLPVAIQSVLNQTFGDFELIVSNNSSTDNTEEIIRGIEDSRIRYVKTDEQLTMGNHWDFALSHARGEYVTFPGDDDAHAVIYLESMKKIIDSHDAEIVACRICKYFYFDVPNVDGQLVEQNSILTQDFSNAVISYAARDAVWNRFAGFQLLEKKTGEIFHAPQLMNAVYRRTLFDETREKLGVVFPNLVASDFYTAVAVLSLADKYCFLDSPLSIHGTTESNTSSLRDKNKIKQFSEKNPQFTRLENVPLKIFDNYNCVVDALMQAKNDLDGVLDDLPIDFTRYFIVSYFTIMRWEEEGHDVAAEKEIFFEALSNQPAELRTAVNARIFDWKSKARKTFGSVLKKTGLLDSYRQRGKEKKHAITGADGNFRDLLECASGMDERFLAKYGTGKMAAGK